MLHAAIDHHGGIHTGDIQVLPLGPGNKWFSTLPAWHPGFQNQYKCRGGSVMRKYSECDWGRCRWQQRERTLIPQRDTYGCDYKCTCGCPEHTILRMLDRQLSTPASCQRLRRSGTDSAQLSSGKEWLENHRHIHRRNAVFMLRRYVTI